MAERRLACALPALIACGCNNYVYEKELDARGLSDLPEQVSGDDGLEARLVTLQAELEDLQTRLGGEKAAFDNLGALGRAIRVDEDPDAESAVVTIDTTNYPGGVTVVIAPNPAEAEAALEVHPTEGVSSTGLDWTVLSADAIVEAGNLHVRNGSADSESGAAGYTDSLDGTGNLIIGWNEMKGGETRTGSHNLVVGRYHSYTSYGAIVAGEGNAASAPAVALLGGTSNRAEAAYAALAGGQVNTVFAGALGGVALGGQVAEVYGEDAAVVGGVNGTATGAGAAVVGGSGGTASGDYALAGGGQLGEASGTAAVVIGGYDVTASGSNASTLGGTSDVADEERECRVNNVQVTVGGSMVSSAAALR